MSNFLVELEQRAQRIADSIEDLYAQADQLRQVGQHLSAYIDFVRTDEHSQLNDAADEPDWTGLSLPDALVEIARRHGGELRTVDAIPELVAKKVCQSHDHARDGIYRAIARRPQFKKVKDGLYRLVGPSATARSGEKNRQSPGAILLPLVQANPLLTRVQALRALLDADYNFHGGNPARIASAALAHALKVAGDDNPAASDDPPSSPAEAADSASPAKHSQVDLFAPEGAVGAESAA